jgi:hypothetical protein
VGETVDGPTGEGPAVGKFFAGESLFPRVAIIVGSENAHDLRRPKDFRKMKTERRRMMQLDNISPDDPARPLETLVPIISRIFATERPAPEEEDSTRYEYALGVVLIEAATHFESPRAFYVWATMTFDRSRATIEHFMQSAFEVNQGRKFAFQYNSPPSRRWPAGPDKWVSPPCMTKEILAKEKEGRVLLGLGLQLIDAGFRMLATNLRTGKGASEEAMARLDKVRTLVKREWRKNVDERGLIVLAEAGSPSPAIRRQRYYWDMLRIFG